MKWSDRKIEEFERLSKLSMLKKFIVIGECKQKLADRTIGDTNDSIKLSKKSPRIKTYPKPFLMMYNIQNECVENLKLLNINDAQITCINFGPFDNGYLLLGLSSGVLLAIEPSTMNIVINLQLF